MLKTYVIKHKTQAGMYWQTRTGWVEAKYATEFNGNDVHKFPLPPFGEWVELVEPSIPRKTA